MLGFKSKEVMGILALSALVAGVVVYASNNIDVVEDAIG